MAALLVAAAAASAHPPVSVVIDARGNVFYSDLRHVWRVAPDGRTSVAVKNVHTHELALDAAGNLYGENLTYDRSRDTWRHSVWRLSATGELRRVIPTRDGFLRNYSFVRDSAGTMYWAVRDRLGLIRKRAPDGRIRIVTTGLKDVRWMHATPGGTLYLIDGDDLVKVAYGKATRIVRRLAGRGTRHALMGLWTDEDENVYIADHARGEVIRVTQSGRVTTALRSPWPWSPTGGTFAPNGDLWLLEASPRNEIRVRNAGPLR